MRYISSILFNWFLNMQLIVISGPSGSGKTTLSERILKNLKNGIILNILAGPSSIYGGYLNDLIGSKNVINLSLWGLLASGILGLSIDKDTIFYFFSVDEYSASVEDLTFGIFNSVSQVTYICVVIGISILLLFSNSRCTAIFDCNEL